MLSADPVHVDLNMAFFIFDDLDKIRLLSALARLLFLNDAVRVKESSRDLPDTVNTMRYLLNISLLLIFKFKISKW